MQLTPFHPNQICLPFFSEVEVRIRQQRWNDKHNRPKKVVLKKKPVSTLPLTTSDSFSLFYDQAKEIATAIGEDLEDEFEIVEWSDGDVYLLHGHLLGISLKNLECRSDEKNKSRYFKSRPKNFSEISESDMEDVRDILHWIYNPGIPDRVNRNINGVVETIDIPFTFGTCCRMLQFDPDIARYRYQHIWDEFIQQQNQFLYQRYPEKVLPGST